jgi:hypothetical protein
MAKGGMPPYSLIHPTIILLLRELEKKPTTVNMLSGRLGLTWETTRVAVKWCYEQKLIYISDWLRGRSNLTRVWSLANGHNVQDKPRILRLPQKERRANERYREMDRLRQRERRSRIRSWE